MKQRGILAAGALAFAGLLIWPEAVLTSLQTSVNACAEVLIPSLFPFLVLTSLLCEAGLGRWTVLPSLLGGYPVAARCCGALCGRGLLTAEEAARRIAVLTCSGPAFVLTAVGVGLCGSRRFGWMLLAGQWTAALLLYGCVLLCEHRRGEKLPCPSRLSGVSAGEALVRATRSSAEAMGLICAYVLVFAALGALLDQAGVYALLGRLPGGKEVWSVLAQGVLEVTTGCIAASGCPNPAGGLLLSFLLGFGGLSVHTQIRALAPGLPLRRYLPVRVLFGLLAAGVTGLLMWAFPQVCGVFAPIRARASGSTIGSVALFLLCTALICQKTEKFPHPAGFGDKKNGQTTSGNLSRTQKRGGYSECPR